jgi:hypothetical protein
VSAEGHAPPSRWLLALSTLGLVLVFAAVWAGVRPTNFGGSDEWLVLDLVPRGILSVPYAHRPLVFLWTLPPALLAPNSLWSYYLTHASWLVGAGCLVFLLARRLFRGWLPACLLAGVIDLVWAPQDYMRLDSVLLCGYSGFTFAALGAVALFVEAWFDGRWLVLALAALVAALTARGFEGTLGLMAGAPLILLQLVKPRSRRLWAWVWSWWAWMAVLAAVAAFQLLAGGDGGNYQLSGLGFDPHPVRVTRRLLKQFGYHLLPLVQGSLPELMQPSVAVAVVAFLCVFGLVARLSGSEAAAPSAALRLVRTAGLGLVLAALGYSLLMLSPSIQHAARTEFLSGPGIALFLASGVVLVASRLPSRARHAGTAVLGAWIVAVGCGRTLAMQREWDEGRSLYARQRASLLGLTSLAPDLEPHSFVLLLEESGTWPTSFTFRHAVSFQYAGRARGHAWGSQDFLYPLYLLPAGVLSAPWPVLREAWGESPQLYRYDELLVVRDYGAGVAEVLDTWPAELLGPLPNGAVYSPRKRIRFGSALPASRAILRETRAETTWPCFASGVVPEHPGISSLPRW